MGFRRGMAAQEKGGKEDLSWTLERSASLGKKLEVYEL